MSKSLKLADGLAVPLEAVTEKLGWIGRTGSGKTYGAMKLAELMLEAGAQIGALDPVGVWRALRVPAAKDGRAFEVVVFGGLYGDLPLEPTAGALIADVVCGRGISFVLDVSQFIPSEQQRFARAFADRFFQRRKAAPAAVHLFLEECQEFIPQNPMGDEALTLHAFQRLWKLGRNFGIGGSLISQRPQEISKKAFNMSGTLFAFQMTGPQERKAVREWVADHGVATDIERVLQTLKTGEPHVESPTFLEVSRSVRILPRVTADLSSTPKVGSATVAKRPLTPIDVEQLRAAMADTLERVKADDPKELRKALVEKDKRIKELEVARGKQDRNIRADIRETPALTDADRQLLRDVREEFVGFKEHIADRADVMLTSIAERAKAEIDAAAAKWTSEVEIRRRNFLERLDKTRVQKVLDKVLSVTDHEQLMRVERRAPAGLISPRVSEPVHKMGDSRQVARSNQPTTAVELAPSEGKVLRILAGAGGQLTRRALAIRSGYSMGGGGFRNVLSALRVVGHIETEANIVRLTTNGFEPEPMDAQDIQRVWQAKLSPAEWRLLEPLLRAHPQALSRVELARAADYEVGGGGFRNTLSVLSTNALIDKHGSTVRAAAELFG